MRAGSIYDNQFVRGGGGGKPQQDRQHPSRSSAPTTKLFIRNVIGKATANRKLSFIDTL